MKFKAYIPYTFIQSKEAKKFGDDNIAGDEIEFTFEDLFGYTRKVLGKEVSFGPTFTARELIIPWLQQGNIPEIVKEKENE